MPKNSKNQKISLFTQFLALLWVLHQKVTKESCRKLKVAFYKPTSCPYLERGLPQGSGNHSFMQFLGSFRLFMNFSAHLVHLSLQPGLDYCQAPPAHQFDAKVMKIWQLVVASDGVSEPCQGGQDQVGVPQVPLLGHGEALETWNFVCRMQLSISDNFL